MPRRGIAGLRILTYHSVEIDRHSRMAVCSKSFRWQLEYVARCFNVITFSQLLEAVRNRRPIDGTKPLAIITFDDGYQDNLRIAAPILEDVGVSACFFVTTGYIGTGRRFEWDQREGRDAPVMSWDEVRELRRRGFEIGSHAVTHRRMGDLGEDEFASELGVSREILRMQLGEDVRVFAYPFGRFRDYSASRRQIVGSFYEVANTSIRGLNHADRLELLELRRTSINGVWAQKEFSAEVEGAFDFLDELRRVTWQLRSKFLERT